MMLNDTTKDHTIPHGNTATLTTNIYPPDNEKQLGNEARKDDQLIPNQTDPSRPTNKILPSTTTTTLSFENDNENTTRIDVEAAASLVQILPITGRLTSLVRSTPSSSRSKTAVIRSRAVETALPSMDQACPVADTTGSNHPSMPSVRSVYRPVPRGDEFYRDLSSSNHSENFILSYSGSLGPRDEKQQQYSPLMAGAIQRQRLASGLGYPSMQFHQSMINSDLDGGPQSSHIEGIQEILPLAPPHLHIHPHHQSNQNNSRAINNINNNNICISPPHLSNRTDMHVSPPAPPVNASINSFASSSSRPPCISDECLQVGSFNSQVKSRNNSSSNAKKLQQDPVFNNNHNHSLNHSKMTDQARSSINSMSDMMPPMMNNQRFGSATVSAEHISPEYFDPMFGGLMRGPGPFLSSSPLNQFLHNGQGYDSISPQSFIHSQWSPLQNYAGQIPGIRPDIGFSSPNSPFLTFVNGLQISKVPKQNQRFDDGQSQRTNGTAHHVGIVSLSGPALSEVNEIPSNCFQKNKKMLTVYELSIFRTESCMNSQNCKQKRTFSKCPWNHDTPRWKRRNPFIYDYKHLMCPSMQPKDAINSKNTPVQSCSAGINCQYAHSIEEQMYHPHVYKSQPCRNGSGCNKFYCPFLHDGEFNESDHRNAKYDKVYPYNTDPYNHLEKWQAQWNKTPRSQSRSNLTVYQAAESVASDSASADTLSPSSISAEKLSHIHLERPYTSPNNSCIQLMVMRLNLFADQHDTLSPLELSIFRIQKCAMKPQCPGVKSPAKCWATHQNVNTGRWQRRNPFVVPYRHLMCDSVRNSRSNGRGMAAVCSRGEACPNAHSIEEQMYHPYVYKTKTCNNLSSTDQRCDKHYCPYVHPDKDTFKYGVATSSPRVTTSGATAGSTSMTITTSDGQERLGIYAKLWISEMQKINAAEVLESLPSTVLSRGGPGE